MDDNDGMGYDFDAFEAVDQAMMRKLGQRTPLTAGGELLWKAMRYPGDSPAKFADAMVAARLAARRADGLVNKKLAAIEAFGTDEFPEHAVIRFGKTMTNRQREPQRYMYAAIKVDGHWYTTGPKGQRYTWDELLVWLVSGDHPTRTFEVLQRADEWSTAIKLAPATLAHDNPDTQTFEFDEK